MPRLLGFALALTLTAFASRLHAQENDASKARALIEKAVKAQGGLEVLTKEVATVRKSKGKFYEDDFDFTGESFSDLKEKRKLVLHGKEGNAPSTRILVMEGNSKGWISFDGISVDLDEAFLKRIQTSMYCDKVCGLVPLLKDKDYTLKLLGESKVKDKDVLGVKVSKSGKPDVNLYFDKTTGHLLKSTNMTTDVNTEKEVFQEVYYEDYRQVDAGATAVKLLGENKQAADGAALVALLKKHTPTAQEREQIAEQITNLGSRDFNTRQKASAAVKKWGGKAAAPLRKALSDSDVEVVRRAEKALESIDQSPEAGVLAAVLTLLELRRPEGAAEALLDYLPWALNDQLAKSATNALAAVAEKGGQPHPAVVKALTDDNEIRKNAAAAVLGKDGGAWRNQGWRRVILEGLVLPRASIMFRDGKRSMDLETVELHFYNRLDDSIFARP